MYRATRNALVLAAGAAMAAPAAAQTQGDLTNAVDFSTTQTQLWSVGAILIGVAVVLMAIRFVRRLVK